MSPFSLRAPANRFAHPLSGTHEAGVVAHASLDFDRDFAPVEAVVAQANAIPWMAARIISVSKESPGAVRSQA
jgi:hypothetical protein